MQLLLGFCLAISMHKGRKQVLFRSCTFAQVATMGEVFCTKIVFQTFFLTLLGRISSYFFKNTLSYINNSPLNV